MAQGFKRRNYFIDKGAQGRFIAWFSAGSLAGGVVAVFCFRYFAARKLDATLYAMRLPDMPMGNLLLEEMFVSSSVAAVFVVLLFVLTARKVFSRIEGPLQKMGASLRAIADGDLQSQVRLRENDDFHEFAREVDSLARSMNSRLSSLRFQAGKISRLCVEKDEEEDVAERLRHHISAMKKEMKAFQL
ncbi:MAG: methyl-accepting chemotaxis protein [Deltaproteobacteria bacterium]|nr:methyl-accepting chemotaxis protein [Deltaproteobacteria bacterium]